MTRSLPLLFLALTAASPAADPPPVPREFRGVWVATVGNIDWPSKPGLPADQQKAELVRILDIAQGLNLNAVVFQVRPAGDALYASDLEPWSAYLTGAQGNPPSPLYDPLVFAVEQAHARGLELHAWFNPYRARHPSDTGPFAPNHLSRTHPELVKTYGKHLWMDPGEPAVQDHSLTVIADVVNRYDIDGVHLDDYFYPYKENGPDGKPLDFPDEPSYARYRDSGGTLAKDDWRRQNVDTFIRRLYEQTKAAKPWVKVGLSPFGIWRPGHPPQIKGFDPYAELYADSRKWLQEGWCDYFSPQLYWPVGQTAQDFPTLLNWWVEQDTQHRPIWPGLITSGVGDKTRNWSAEEITKQVRATRAVPAATGHIHFSMKAILDDRPGLTAALKSLYPEPALVPPMSWLDTTPPPKPPATLDKTSNTLTLKPKGDEKPRLYVLRIRERETWTTRILPATSTKAELPKGSEAAAISVVDHFGNESEPARLDAPAR